MQNKKQSLIESITNTFIGFFVSFLSTFLIFPIMGFESNPSKNLIITIYFTAISILRGYLVRRYYNSKKQ